MYNLDFLFIILYNLINIYIERCIIIMTRKQARDLAFKLLYQLDIQKESGENILEMFYEENFSVDSKSKEYISNVVLGAELNMDVINETISKYLKGWNLNRISKLSVAALRLAIFEIMYCPDIPDTVAANEAVTLLKTYEGEEGIGFVNGILASVIGGKAE